MKTFKKFKLDYYDSELFEKLDIQEEGEYNYYGNSKMIKEKEIINYIMLVGDNDKRVAKKVCRYILKTLKIMKHRYGYEYFWLAVRTFTPTNKYENTRWHTDGRILDTYRKQFKLVSVPKGESTMFVEPEQELRNKFLEIQKKRNMEFKPDFSNFDEVIKKYGKKLKKLFKEEKVYQVKNNYMVEFNLGDPMTAAIHSEPDIKEPRLFFSLVFGTKEEIEDKENKQKLFSKKMK